MAWLSLPHLAHGKKKTNKPGVSWKTLYFPSFRCPLPYHLSNKNYWGYWCLFPSFHKFGNWHLDNCLIYLRFHDRSRPEPCTLFNTHSNFLFDLEIHLLHLLLLKLDLTLQNSPAWSRKTNPQKSTPATYILSDIDLDVKTSILTKNSGNYSV